MLSALSVPTVLPYDTGMSSTARPRRRFTAAYKQQILAAADACTKPGELGALLRREGLHSSHLSSWRAAAGRGAEPRRGPKPHGPDPAAKRIAALERALAKSTKRLERAELIIDAQKKWFFTEFRETRLES
jgi:transposase